MLRGHPRSEDLERGLRRYASRLRPWSGFYYRSASPRWTASADLTSGSGSLMHGGRWNPPGVRTVYGSLSPELSLAEALAATRRLGIPDDQTLPKVTVAGRANLAGTLRLDAQVRRSLEVTLSDLLVADWEEGREEILSQALGRVAAALGIEGLLVPSAAARRGENLVVFPDNLRPGSRLEARGLRGGPAGGPGRGAP